MEVILIISLFLNFHVSVLTDDVVFEYSRLYFTSIEGVGFNDAIMHDLGNTDDRSKHNYDCVYGSSAELNRLFYRYPRDRLQYAWILL